MKNTSYQYVGNELELFAKASNWKKYVATLIAPYIKGAVLEAGAGIGTNTAYFITDRVTSWLLLEPDQQFSDTLTQLKAENKLPIECDIFNGYSNELAENSSFDCVIYIDVLEHIEHDKKEIESATRLLKNGGYLVVLSPAHQFLMSPFDHAIGHFRRYSSISLAAVGNDELLQIKMLLADSVGFFASLANKLLLRQQYPTAKQIHFWDTWMVPISRLTDRLLLRKAGKTIIGIWQKK